MEINKKIYKYTSIISLMVAIVLLANLIIPALTIADNIEPSSSKISLNEISYDGETTLTISGSVLAEYTSYELHLAKGNVTTPKVGNDATDEQKAAYYDSLYTEFAQTDNVDSYPSTANSGAQFTWEVTVPKIEENNVTYKVLCIAKKADGAYALAYVTKTFNIPEGSGTENQVTENQVPENQVPENQVPENQVPENQVPENQVPENQVPENQVPENQVPENQVPENQVPENQVPENQVPENQVPENQVPENQVPENQTPGSQPTENQQQGNQTPENQTDDDEIHVDTKPAKDDKPTGEEKDLTPAEPQNKTEQQPAQNGTNEPKTTPSDTNIQPQNITIEDNNSDENIPQTGSNDTILISAIITLSILSLGSFVRYKTMK